MDSDAIRQHIQELRIHIDNMIFCTLILRSLNLPEKESCVSDYLRKELHTHPYAEVFACVEGSITVCFDGYEMVLPSGSIMIVPQNVQHVLYYAKTKDAKWGWMAFYCIQRYAHESHNIYQLYHRLCTGDAPITVHNVPDICRTVQNISKTIWEHNSTQSLMLLHAADQIASVIMHGNDVPSLSEKESADSTSVPHAAQLDSLIQSQFHMNLNVNIAAKILYLSPRQIDRISRQHYKMTFHQALNHRRACVAAELLSRTDLPLTQICESAGFNSYAAFIGNFKKIYGITPAQYRMQHK